MVTNLFSHSVAILGLEANEGVWENGDAENIRTLGEETNKITKKFAYWWAKQFAAYWAIYFA
jgi:hypothetical protein